MPCQLQLCVIVQGLLGKRGVDWMSHHKKIYIVDPLAEVETNILHTIGHVRRRNDGTILSIWINTGNQSMLFLPEHPELILEEEE